MSATKGEAVWPLIVNLSNSIIGVSVLAMPFCMRECGLILGAALVVGTGLLTRVTGHLLMKGAHQCRRRSYEAYAGAVLGEAGRLGVQLSLVLFLLSQLVAFYVVIGDLGPSVVAGMVAVPEESLYRLRVLVMCLIALWVIVPLALLRSLESLSLISSCAILFYGAFVLRMLLLSVPELLRPGGWWEEVNWWRPGGVLQCLPILLLAISCQTQLFVTADGMVEPSPAKMDVVTAGAVNLCTAVYLAVGILGYITFQREGAALGGDVLVLLPPSPLTQLLKMGFILSVAVSFPLILFPVRLNLYSLYYGRSCVSPDGEVLIPDAPFRNLTLALVGICLVVGISIPNVELVLGLTGALVGSTVCVALPSLLFLYAAPDHQFYSRIAAQGCLFIGAFIAIVCTYATLHGPAEVHQVFQPPPPANLSHQPPQDKVAPALPDAGKGGPLDDGGARQVPALPEAAVQAVAGDAEKDVNSLGAAKRVEPPLPNDESKVDVAPKAPPVQRVTEPPTAPPALPLEAKAGAEDGKAAALLQELKDQQREQGELIQEQRKLVDSLKATPRHPRDHRGRDDPVAQPPVEAAAKAAERPPVLAPDRPVPAKVDSLRR